MVLRKLVVMLCLLSICGLALVLRLPEFDRKNGIKEVFIHDHGDRIEYTIVFWDEDHPRALTDLLYDLYRFYRWGRFYDIETFFVYPDRIYFPDDFCESESFFQLEDLHNPAELTLDLFEHLDGEPVVYVSTWNHMFSNKPLSGVGYLSYKVEDSVSGTRADAERNYSWRYNLTLKITVGLFFASLISMVITILLKTRSRSCVVFKGLTTAFIATVAMLNSQGIEWLIFAGLAFSLIGDVFLEFDRLFLQGMLAFFTTHLLYSIAFVKLFGVSPWWIFVLVYTVVLLQYIPLRKYLGPMKIAVLLYTLMIATMLALSFAVLRHEIYYARTLIPAGAVLFAFSDSYLAWDRFVRKLPMRNFLVLFTYFLGQLFIALSTVI
ncbi:MAG: lysoplasmalogenase [Pseudothermotoga sp.]|uniref:lysoplasmalogenase n=1 Tax=Pseudothermotoga sp. TaxID=2033661 RepID=UPI001997E35B|nr:lysoplasmalogenase [Pseudothermotoga sp.]